MGALSAASAFAIAPLNAGSALRLPLGPMMLSRRLERDLHDGEQIIVERSWEIQFERTSRDVQIAGQFISANVQAPARLKALADIEQSQRKEGMFPLTLSETGLLVAGAQADGRAAIAQAMNAAREMIEKSPSTLVRKVQASRHLLQMQEAAQPLMATMPADLFFPSRPTIVETQTVNLPDGLVGEFELRYKAVSAPKGGWLDHAERQIVTRIGTNQRRSVEHWRLSLA